VIPKSKNIYVSMVKSIKVDQRYSNIGAISLKYMSGFQRYVKETVPIGGSGVVVQRLMSEIVFMLKSDGILLNTKNGIKPIALFHILNYCVVVIAISTALVKKPSWAPIPLHKSKSS